MPWTKHELPRFLLPLSTAPNTCSHCELRPGGRGAIGPRALQGALCPCKGCPVCPLSLPRPCMVSLAPQPWGRLVDTWGHAHVAPGPDIRDLQWETQRITMLPVEWGRGSEYVTKVGLTVVMTVARARKDPACRARLPKQATLPSSGDQCRSKDGHAGPGASKSGLGQPGDGESHGQEGTLAATAVVGTGGRWPALRDRGQMLVRRSHSRVQGIRSLPVPPGEVTTSTGAGGAGVRGPSYSLQSCTCPMPYSVPQHAAGPAPSPTCPTSRPVPKRPPVPPPRPMTCPMSYPCPTARPCFQTAPRPMACPTSCPIPRSTSCPFPAAR